MYCVKKNTPDNLQKILEFLLSGEAVSGEAISQKLGISRNAVWKNVQTLKNMGFHIEAERNVGYRLQGEKLPDKLYPYLIFPILSTKKLGNSIFWQEEIGSTNDKAGELAKEGAEEGTIILAEKQTKGRGRRGRAWESEESLGIYMSAILRPKRPLAEAAPYTFLGAYAVLRVLEQYGLKPQVKWPNDVFVGGRKISGVLAELSAIGPDIRHIVLGIGLNVNQTEFSPDIPGTSLKIELQIELCRREVLAALLLHLEEGYEKLSQDVHWLIEIMKKYSILLGERVTVTGGVELEGIAEDIASDGALLVRVVENGEERVVKVWAGDVSVRKTEA